MLTSLLGFALARRGFTVTVALLIAVAGVVAFRHLKLRSEEHTSELQSLTNLVCRLLLEKKNHLRSQRRQRHQQAPIRDVPSRSSTSAYSHRGRTRPDHTPQPQVAAQAQPTDATAARVSL